MLQRKAHGARKGLEDGFALVVGIEALQVVNVQRHAGVIDKALEEFEDQLRIEPDRCCRR